MPVLLVCIACLALCLVPVEVLAGRRVYFQEKNDGSYAVYIEERLLLRLRYPGGYSTIQDRAERLTRELETFFSNPPEEAVTFFVNPVNGRVEGHCNDHRIFTVYKEDAAINNSGVIDLALLWLNRLQMEYYHLLGCYRSRVREKINGQASWYGHEFDGNATAAGETFNPYAFTAAHRSFPPGTLVVVTNPVNGRRVVIRINDWGPQKKAREIDLSLAAARAIGIKEEGVMSVVLEVLR
ncbi:MAG TPA: septal ring lytic transglycosylase RlpA family protein [Atribacteraceae bacterium]|nr:septal ring lytic transglycosylase RlpA family protein [Atribacteraceae bacterium]